MKIKIYISILFCLFLSTLLPKAAAQCGGSRSQDSLILVKLNTTTKGSGWRTKWNLSQPMTTWFGVTLLRGRVTDVVLANNNLTDSLPAELANLCALTKLDVSYNSLKWTLPSLLNLQSLKFIDVRNNQLTGVIPTPYSTTLQYFYMGDNRFTGTFPNFDYCYNLLVVQLDGNMLSGTIPSQFFTYHPSLQIFSIYVNQFTGSIPKEIGVCRQLLEINLGRNQFTGSIPTEINNIWTSGTSLRILKLNDNRLTGIIPQSLSNLYQLQHLELTNNQLTGSIPPRLDSLRQLEYLNLAANQLTGSIPTTIGAMNSIRELILYSNKLTGTIPASLGSRGSLTLISVSYNQLSGVIPSEIGNLKNLQYFIASNNGLNGALPTLSNVYQLRVLNLRSNQFTGSIPPQYNQFDSLYALVLSYNRLTGTVPAALVGLRKLAFFEIDYNRLDSLPNFSTGFLRYRESPFVIDATYSGSATFAGNKFTFDDLVSNMTLKAKPSFYYTYLEQDSIICTPKTTTLTRGGSFTIPLNIDGGLTTNVYRWFKDGKLIDRTNVNKLTLNNLQPCHAGIYSCQVTNPAVQGMTLFCPSQSLAVPEPFQSCQPYEITTFPNPVENTLNITIVSPPDDVRLMRLSNMLGQVVWSRRFDEGDVINGLSIDCGDFPNGSYFLSLYTEGGLLSLTKRVQVLKK